MATMVPGRKPPRKIPDGIEPLTKTDVIEIVNAEENLRSYQDEKRDIYHREHDDMSAAFQDARQGRGVLVKLYDQRNQEVLDRLVEMRKKTDKEAKKHLDRLKVFSKEFEESTANGKKTWKHRFVSERTELTNRNTAIGENITSLDAAIVQEHEECLAHAAAETEPLIEALSRHKAFLEQQVEDRGEEYERFMVDMKQRFTTLRKRIAEEEEARTIRGDEMRTTADVRYRELEKKMAVKDPQVRKGLDDVRQRMADELEERTSAQERKIADMMKFMGEFEQSISEAGRRQEKAKAHLLQMKAMLREETPPA
mmetsp:Transcript_14988/g.26256  ORF Transcript_14988/g.26256 Transcript_14988/m.26256 type:complete len:311 (+) Transcript_14988:55-987(+)